MSSTRPYLVRAIYDWIVDNRCTPHLLLDAGVQGLRVPRQAIKDGRVVLNIAPHAVDRLELGLEEVRFNARFSGVSHTIVAPVEAVLAIYARENGQGMMFPSEAQDESVPATAEVADGETGPVLEQDAAPAPSEPAPDRPRPSLRIVK